VSIEKSPEANGNKKPWETPRLQVLSISGKFDPRSGMTRAQWEAALDLCARATEPPRQSRIASVR
jgi:hypothetical protein